ncbi:MAG: VWA domain-containing protein [Deltaproteobacteria bacterium]|nr:VWA domain-containing protein [Deltaproteobacteria bacterium]
MIRVLSLLLLGLAGSLALGQGDVAHAQLLVPDDRALPPLALESHRVTIDVTAGVAVTRIEQTWRNDSARPLEATYLFPLPRDAVVSGFELEVNGKMQKGEMVEREKAARIYHDIVSRLRDPGLVEWIDRQLFQARIFPVPARGTQRMKIEYTQSLEAVSGTLRLVYPLKTAAAAAKTLQDFTLTANIRQPLPIRNVYSPSHKVRVAHKDEQTATVGFEDDGAWLDKDFVLYIGVSKSDLGINVLTHRPAGEPGYFLLMAAPRAHADSDEVQGKNVTFVLDTSGSMGTSKMDQAKAALRYAIDRLGPDDRFDIVRFSSDVERFSRSGLVVASSDAKERARKFVDGFEAAGGTAIDEALQAALETEVRDTHLVLFVTDGRPTVGDTDTKVILEHVRKKNAGKARIFVLGVGEDLNTHLCDLVAQENGGTSHYVRPSEDVMVAIGGLYEQIAYPVLTDVELAIGDDAKTYAVLPKKVPDLFRGQQILVAGRYRGDGDALIRIRGKLGGKTQTFDYEATFPGKTDDARFVASLWAHRQVGFLLDQIRLNGESPELREEVIQLAKQYGIVTPYTSWLVVDDSELGHRPPPPPIHVPVPRQPRPLPEPWEREGDARPMAPTATPSAEKAEQAVLGGSASSDGFREDRGRAGVDAAETVRIYKEKKDDTSVVRSLKNVGGRVFAWDGKAWVDQRETSSLERVRIAPFSSAWSEIAKLSESIRAALGLGDEVRIVIGKYLVVVTDGGQSTLSPDLLGKLKAAAK